MRDPIILLVHLIATLARLMGPGGLRSVVAESVMVKHQLLILNRSRHRSPNLRASDRILAGVCALFMRPARVIRSAIVLRPSTILAFHRTLRTRKYRLLFSPKSRRTGPKGPSKSTGGRYRGAQAAQPHGAASDLGAEGAVLFEQIGARVGLALVEPRGHGEQHEADGRRVNHAGQHSPETLAVRGRLINGTLRESRGTSKSAVSRRFVAKTAAQLAAWQRAPLEALDLQPQAAPDARFLSVHGLVQNLFRVGRHLLRAVHHRLLRTRSFRVWDAVTYAC